MKCVNLFWLVVNPVYSLPLYVTVRSSKNSTVQSCFGLQMRVVFTEICLHNMKAILGEYAHAFNADYHQ